MGRAISFFTGEGLTVNVPLTDSQAYDLIVDSVDGLDRVQCKYTQQKQTAGGAYWTSLRVSSQHRNKLLDRNAVDSVFIVTPVAMYWIPSASLLSTSHLFLTNKWDVFKVVQRL